MSSQAFRGMIFSNQDRQTAFWRSWSESEALSASSLHTAKRKMGATTAEFGHVAQMFSPAAFIWSESSWLPLGNRYLRS
jgi:hypothetical protein